MTALGRNFGWRAFWADLLKGTGKGLLVYDGSRAAQAALAGLDTFEAAQRERRQRDRADEGGDIAVQRIQAQISSIYPGLELSAAEWAHLWRLRPQEREAWLREMADADRPQSVETVGTVTGNPDAGHRVPTWRPIPPAAGPAPLSPNPYDGWALAASLPLAPNGQLTIPSFRR